MSKCPCFNKTYPRVVLPIPGGPTISPTVPQGIPLLPPVLEPLGMFCPLMNASSSRWDDVLSRACPSRWRIACATEMPILLLLISLFCLARRPRVRTPDRKSAGEAGKQNTRVIRRRHPEAEMKSKSFVTCLCLSYFNGGVLSWRH
jgi:hypothetical protein